MSNLILSRLVKQGYKQTSDNTFKKSNTTLEITGTSKDSLVSIRSNNELVKVINFRTLRRELRKQAHMNNEYVYSVAE
jgi:hypothetical protein